MGQVSELAAKGKLHPALLLCVVRDYYSRADNTGRKEAGWKKYIGRRK